MNIAACIIIFILFVKFVLFPLFDFFTYWLDKFLDWEEKDGPKWNREK